MATGRTLKLLALSTALTGLLGACVSPGSAQAPAGVRIEGAWKLDRDASDDPQKALDKLRQAAAQNARRAARRVAAQPQATARGGGRRGGGGLGGSTDAEEEEQRMPSVDQLQYNPEMQALLAFIRHGDYLTVRQSPDLFSLDYGSSRRSYTPGAHSVVSAETGVADQTSGWKGGSFVINVRPQIGPAITEEYSVAADHGHLVVKLHVNATDLPAIEIKQVYVRTDEALPRAMPTL